MKPTTKYPRQKVSVLIIVYNTPAAILTEAVISLLNQSRQPDEIVIVNNGSAEPETNFYLDIINGHRDRIKVLNVNKCDNPVLIGLQNCKYELVLHFRPVDKAKYDLIKNLKLK
jgi:glycosyltransferase involved in cell wall biosynthesis